MAKERLQLRVRTVLLLMVCGGLLLPAHLPTLSLTTLNPNPFRRVPVFRALLQSMVLFVPWLLSMFGPASAPIRDFAHLLLVQQGVLFAILHVLFNEEVILKIHIMFDHLQGRWCSDLSSCLLFPVVGFNHSMSKYVPDQGMRAMSLHMDSLAPQ